MPANCLGVLAGSMNNRADRRDDGLRHDRPSDRPRGESPEGHLDVYTMLIRQFRAT